MKDNGGLSFLKKLTKIKGVGFIAIGVGAAILLLLFPASSGSAEPETASVMTSDEYCALLEAKAEALICELDGVKECRVFITLASGYTYVYATDQKVAESYSPDGAVAGKETEKTVVLTENEKGSAPILLRETMPEVTGVAVVCKSATYETQYRIIELMCALFDVKSNRIKVQA